MMCALSHTCANGCAVKARLVGLEQFTPQFVSHLPVRHSTAGTVHNRSDTGTDHLSSLMPSQGYAHVMHMPLRKHGARCAQQPRDSGKDGWLSVAGSPYLTVSNRLDAFGGGGPARACSAGKSLWWWCASKIRERSVGLCKQEPVVVLCQQDQRKTLRGQSVMAQGRRVIHATATKECSFALEAGACSCGLQPQLCRSTCLAVSVCQMYPEAPGLRDHRHGH